MKQKHSFLICKYETYSNKSFHIQRQHTFFADVIKLLAYYCRCLAFAYFWLISHWCCLKSFVYIKNPVEKNKKTSMNIQANQH